jgi:hypothetical protein
MTTVSFSPEKVSALRSIVANQVYDLNNDLDNKQVSDCAVSVLTERYELLQSILEALSAND